MVRKVLRKPAVLAATGWSNSTLYAKISEGKFPKPTRLDPDSRAVIWFEDEVEAFQKAAVERQQTSPPDPDPLIRPKRKTLGRRVAGSDGAPGAGEAA
jgi:prophage regulatory protein